MILNLKQGGRRITLIFSGNTSIDASALVADYTFEKGWQQATIESVAGNKGLPAGSRYLLVKVSPGNPAFVPYDKKIHGDSFNTEHPILKIRIKNE